MVQRASHPPTPVGRPRSGDRQRPGDTPRDEILDAAAELFTSRGYAATSTRTIAEAVGLRQASLYYHFASKEELLAELLAGTVQPSLAYAAELSARPDLALDARLFALAAFDTGVLCGGRWNLGALYLLPELRGERFAGFRAERSRLRSAYADLIAGVTATSASASRIGGPETSPDDASPDGGADLTDLVFALVEGVITIRSERDRLDVAATSRAVAAACLRLCGVAPERIDELTRGA